MEPDPRIFGLSDGQSRDGSSEQGVGEELRKQGSGPLEVFFLNEHKNREMCKV